jgi:hypothetical protein
MRIVPSAPERFVESLLYVDDQQDSIGCDCPHSRFLYVVDGQMTTAAKKLHVHCVHSKTAIPDIGWIDIGLIDIGDIRMNHSRRSP